MKKIEWFKQPKKKKKSKDELTPEKSLKLAGNLLLVGGGIYAGTKLLGEI